MHRYDSRVKAMEVDERPTEQYSDIGGLDKQIQEVCYRGLSSCHTITFLISLFEIVILLLILQH